MTLADWRRETVGLSLLAAAKRANISQALAASIEQHPERASLGAVLNYVRALGGDLRVVLSHGGDKTELSL